MRNVLCIACAILLAASGAVAGGAVWQIPATVSTAAVDRVASSPGFIGTLEEVEMYGASDATGVVTLAVVDPYSGAAVTVATNAALTSGKKVWRPRIVPPAVTGATALSITNSGDALYLDGETVRATLSGVTGTNKVLRFRVKILKQ
jgi:hypothetical protein